MEVCLTSTPTIQTILTAITSIVTEAISWIGSFITVVMDNPLLLFFVVFAVVGTGVGLISRLMRL